MGTSFYPTVVMACIEKHVADIFRQNFYAHRKKETGLCKGETDIEMTEAVIIMINE